MYLREVVARGQGQYRLTNLLCKRDRATARLQSLRHVATLNRDECLTRECPTEPAPVADSLR
jgi:hypothetical protein